MKAILVAGGTGSRLYPFTRYTHKTLLPLHRRPVIDYALATIRRAGITDITIIGNRFIGQIAQHVGTGLPGENIHYVIEEEPKGVHHALNLARSHVEGSRVLVYFSDNITTIEFTDAVSEFRAAEDPPGCRLVGRNVEDPERFGVAVFGENGELTDIVEKPKDPPSSFAIGGIYLFDETFWSRLDSAVGSSDGGVSITDVNRTYVAEGSAKIIDWPDSLWIDCGTPDALLEAAKYAESGRLSPLPCNLRDGDYLPES
ncbi:MAG: sugar phosphate nucleotidyltransferase [Candidatus Thermoplasmatota archaeon]|nr:sugar phosphate nucleotidyltransferase [Candidatus Thermoplasmatota archaeon]